MKNNRAKGILVVPRWPAQPWFPLFKKNYVYQTQFSANHESANFSPQNSMSNLARPFGMSISLVAGRLSAERFVEKISQMNS